MKRKVSLLLLISALALTGCASTPFNAAPDAAATPAERLGTLQQQQAAAPDDIAVTTAVEFSRQAYVRAELKEADRQVAQGNHAAAIDHLENVLGEDPGNLKAAQMLEQVKRRQQMAVDLARAQRIGGEKPQEALEIARRILAEQPNHAGAKRLRDTMLRQSQASRAVRPQLSDALRKPVSLNFKQQPLANIFDVISRVSGVNFVFDRDVDTSQAATLLAERTTAEDAINLLLRTNQLEKKVLDKHTLLVYPSQPEKARNYTEFAIRTFFLSHADAKSVMAALRQMVKPKDVYVDERVNAVVMRDTPETIQVAERVVMGLDIPQSEVTLDVQVLEVNMNDSLDLGVQYPGKIQFNALGGVEGGALTLGDLLRLNRDRVGVSSESGGLALAIDLLQKQGKTKTLANRPRRCTPTRRCCCPARGASHERPSTCPRARLYADRADGGDVAAGVARDRRAAVDGSRQAARGRGRAAPYAGRDPLGTRCIQGGGERRADRAQRRRERLPGRPARARRRRRRQEVDGRCATVFPAQDSRRSDVRMRRQGARRHVGNAQLRERSRFVFFR